MLQDRDRYPGSQNPSPSGLLKVIAGFFQPFSDKMGCDMQALACFSG